MNITENCTQVANEVFYSYLDTINDIVERQKTESRMFDFIQAYSSKWYLSKNVLEKMIDFLIDVIKTQNFNAKIEIPITREDEIEVLTSRLSQIAVQHFVKHSFQFLFEIKNLMLRIGYRVPEVKYVEYNQFEISNLNELEVLVKYMAYTLCMNDQTRWNTLVSKFKSIGINL